MTIVRVKGFKIWQDRKPPWKWRCQHRKTGVMLDLSKHPLGSAEFFAECARIAALTVAAGEPKPGTLGALIAKYRAHDAFRGLAARTKSDYQKIFDWLKPIDDTPLIKFDRPLVVRIRDKAASKGRKFANDVKARLSTVFGWGAERGYIDGNPASNIKDIRRKRGLPDANRPWSDEERHAVFANPPPQLLSMLGLMAYTGLGPGDAAALPKTFYKNGEIATRRSKTGEPVYWPCPAPLVDILESAPEHNAITLCANSYGRPWTDDGFSASWRKYRDKLAKEGRIGPALTLYGLRHTVAVILREIGMDERTIADALGQATIEMARRYAKGADLKPKMKGVVRSFEEELNKRKTKTVKPDAK